MKKHAVGSDIDAYCTKCKMVLSHALVAVEGQKPRRVRCNTCGGEHNYRPTKPQPKPAPKAAKSKASPRRTRQTWDDIVKEASGKPHKTYSMSGSFSEGDWIEHAVFGLGCVQSFIAPNKITVRFSDSTRTLVCNRT